ncbi:MAG TPA: hypothetical protein VGN32_18735 [Ktedonobacterales bacterium]|nr:hypothetical protein [Ktedonobacterales bacterium]
MTSAGQPGRRSSGAYDQALKILGERSAPQLAALLIPDMRLEGPLSGELPASERRVDWIWRARFRDQPCVLHVEFQLRGKADMAHRMFVYGSRIVAEYDLPPLSLLVYLIQTKPLAMSPYVVALPGKEIITHHFDVVRLWELDPAPILTGGLSGLVPIVPLMRGARPEQLPTLAEQVLELPELNALQRGDLVSMLATFGALRFPRIDIWEVLRSSTMLSELMNELIQDSPFLRKIHDDAEVHGREEGREAGREAGREEGRLLEARSMLREMAQARFPEISDADLAGIDSIASVERLHALIRATVSSDSAQSLLLAVGEALG